MQRITLSQSWSFLDYLLLRVCVEIILAWSQIIRCTTQKTQLCQQYTWRMEQKLKLGHSLNNLFRLPRIFIQVTGPWPASSKSVFQMEKPHILFHKYFRGQGYQFMIVNSFPIKLKIFSRIRLKTNPNFRTHCCYCFTPYNEGLFKLINFQLRKLNIVKLASFQKNIKQYKYTLVQEFTWKSKFIQQTG